MKLNKEVAQALTNLRGNPDFTQVLKWLTATREQGRDKLEKAEGPQLLREQGRVSVLSDFLACNADAPTTTEKLKSLER